MSEQFLNEVEDVQWLKDTHLKYVKHPNFKSFLLKGNADWPAKVTLFRQKNPNCDTTPAAEFITDDNGFLLRV